MSQTIIGKDLCIHCGLPIPQERQLALPGIQTCIKCSTTQKVLGKNVYAHKTAGVCEVMTPREFSNFEKLDRRKRRNHGF